MVFIGGYLSPNIDDEMTKRAKRENGSINRGKFSNKNVRCAVFRMIFIRNAFSKSAMIGGREENKFRRGTDVLYLVVSTKRRCGDRRAI